MSIELQKLIADEVLDRLCLIDPHAILAGYAVRDWYFNKEASDLDIFFYAPQASNLTMMYKMFNQAGFIICGTKLGEAIPELYKKNPELKAVYETIIKGVKVQLVRMSSPTHNSVLPNFPLNICMAWYKDGQAHYTKHFLRSVKYKCIYKTSDIYNKEHQYIKKICDKFPDYKYYSSVVEAFDAILE